MDTKRAWIEKLMREACSADQGRVRLASMVKDAKQTANCAVELAMSMNKFANDHNVACKRFACESECEETVYSAIAMATKLINQARELVTSEYLLAIKEANRDAK